MTLTPHPFTKMRDYIASEIQWEFDVEYLKYSRPVFPDAFASFGGFLRAYKEAPLAVLTDWQLRNLGNSMAWQGVNRGEWWVHHAFAHRRDTRAILSGIKEGMIPPPIVLQHSGDYFHLMSGQTRLAAGMALGLSVPVKLIQI